MSAPPIRLFRFLLRAVSQLWARLRLQHGWHDALVAHAPFGVIATDRHGRVGHANAAAEEMLGYAPGELIGRRAAPTLLLPDETASCPAGLQECQLRRKDGVLLPVQLSLAGVEGGGQVATVHDISERRRAEEHILQLAHYDTLTGLPNRTLVSDRLTIAIERARRQQTRIGVLLLDLDHFKHINDTLGHDVGDEVLRVAGQRLKDGVRTSDTVARMGGDEFVVMLSDLHNRLEAEAVAQKLLQAFAEAIPAGQRTLRVTPSIGVAVYPEDGIDLPQLLQCADLAMYAAKSSGRNAARSFRPDMKQATHHRVELEADLRLALEREELHLHYQPLVCLMRGSVIRLEALLRWQHPQRGAVSPVEFIPIAEECGLILRIGEWVLRRACHDVKALRDRCGQDLQVAVNLSPMQVQHGGLVELVNSALADSGLPAGALELEITEGVLIQDSKAAIEALSELRARGVRIAIDDFGTGYSSLSYLARFPLDTIKLDRSFVRDLHVDENDAAIASSVLAMGRSLKLEVVAEGVETEAQRDFLQQRGCHIAQGFLFSRPQPLESIARWIGERQSSFTPIPACEI